jgi:L-ribulose-5-phosphate 4-epimerase
MRDEGVTKYTCHFSKAEAPAMGAVSELIACRDRLFEKNLIGVYPDGIGFGNVSIRIGDTKNFYITGTQTGHKPLLEPDDISHVTAYDIDRNEVYCTGQVAASSESMTHAAIYELDASIAVVVHVHHAELWQRGQGTQPTTRREVPYGTPAMAYEIARLHKKSDLSTRKILIMAGHDEGVICFGATFAEAERTFAEVLKKSDFKD